MKKIAVLSLNVVLLGLLVAALFLPGQSVLVAHDYIKRPVPHVKPGAALDLTYSQVNLDVAGAQYAVNVDIDSGYSSGDMSLDVKTSEGLYIVDGDLTANVSLSKGQIARPFEVMAVAPGRYYIYVNAKVDSGDRQSSRALTFIVQVGEEKDDSDQYYQTLTEDDGEVLVSMPAREEIIR